MTTTTTVRSQLTTVLIACTVTLAMLAVGVPAATAGEEVDNTAVDDGAIHALEDGEELYLVFGAELGDRSLEEYIESHASGEVDAEVTQYQSVDQVNINQQVNATSISIDGGEATAVQEANQYNDNEQIAEAAAANIQGESMQFEDVGSVNVIIGNGEGKQFDGWGIADKKGDKSKVDPDQAATAEVTQAQSVGQLNYNEQNTAFAIAENDSEAVALQQSQQSNQNVQQGVANATNIYSHDGGFQDQSASASVIQGQAVDQANLNQQDGAVAIAVGENSSATAIQMTDQTNLNGQVGVADAENIISSLAGMNVATAGTDDAQLVDTETEVETGPSHTKEDKDNQGSQTLTSEVTQEQSIEQMNVNLQNTAFAIATNGSEATAVQMAYQENINTQVGLADALNVYATPGYSFENAVRTSTTSVTVGGDDVDGFNGLAYDYDTAQTNEGDQYATAQLEQVQAISQENINEQQAAIAVAEDGGSAGSSQISMQETENVQFGAVAAGNLWVE